MEQVGYGVIAKGQACGIWPVPISEARITAKRYADKGCVDVVIVTVHAGAKVPLTEPAPIFPPAIAA